ncbi:hypothetical protein [Pseudorhizobium flavum]|uniref:Uncharacterized protein n=1 Tax=Pseudorhizobium flavum TaxID=1335061 RepID=A0A7W9Z1X8_9HYPH|nr:hypothetical protein [Pseudorhizobium flavum]MBB6182559.1 hypothetical protein [Pseudorhizobium flavum]CAD6599356.1 hypothetical protein RFYW14_00666 [Pseudorhizobium flavum]
MWIELDKNEVATILAATDNPSVIAKLTPSSPHPDADTFIEAADGNDYFHVGGYVLGWLWVPNEAAGFDELNDFDDYDISRECRELLESVYRLMWRTWMPTRSKNWVKAALTVFDGRSFWKKMIFSSSSRRRTSQCHGPTRKPAVPMAMTHPQLALPMNAACGLCLRQ